MSDWVVLGYAAFEGWKCSEQVPLRKTCARDSQHEGRIDDVPASTGIRPLSYLLDSAIPGAALAGQKESLIFGFCDPDACQESPAACQP